ncbi:hypothetical protein EJ03DRAFT_109779 [Teratosphaeria nubilosa]|uniref:MYND-type domain-containing protein n=1 Tax=Teratosphaeria nubilosa TaxID=161662 RepID=A0A6G1L9G6_9PEZI|nr:hypothetical protein EJ03DRAFT_109779 [Teratosphaeria nubilosa]
MEIRGRMLAPMGRFNCRSKDDGHSCGLCKSAFWCSSKCQREDWATHMIACEESRRPKPPRPSIPDVWLVYVTPPPNAFGSILLENWHNKSPDWRDIPLAHAVGFPLCYAPFDPTEANSKDAPHNRILSIFHTCFDTDSADLFRSPDTLRGIVCFGRSDGKSLMGRHLTLLQMFITGAVEWVQQSPTKGEAHRRLERTFRKETFQKFWVEVRRMEGWWGIDGPFDDEMEAADSVPQQLTPSSPSPSKQQTSASQQTQPPPMQSRNKQPDMMHAAAMNTFDEQGRMLQRLPPGPPYGSLLEQLQFAPLDTFSPALLETSISAMSGAMVDTFDYYQDFALQPAFQGLTGDPSLDQPACPDIISLDLSQQSPGVVGSDTCNFFGQQGYVPQQHFLRPSACPWLDQFATANTVPPGFSPQSTDSMDNSSGTSSHQQGQPDTIPHGLSPQSKDSMGTFFGSTFHQQPQHCDYLHDFLDPAQAMEEASRKEGVDEVPWLAMDDEFVWEPFELSLEFG